MARRLIVGCVGPLCYRKANGKWLIVHEQVSVSVDLGNGKAMLNLTP
jgi:hypothetical protein